MTANIMEDWDIRYSDYVGDLTLFDKKIGQTNRSFLRTDIDDRTAVTYDTRTNEPIMVEIRNADEVISGIGKLDKREVIKKAKEYLNA